MEREEVSDGHRGETAVNGERIWELLPDVDAYGAGKAQCLYLFSPVGGWYPHLTLAAGGEGHYLPNLLLLGGVRYLRDIKELKRKT